MGFKLAGFEFAPFLLPVRRRLQTFAVFFWMGTFLFCGPLCGSTLVLTFLYSKWWYLALAYISWMIYDLDTCNRGGRAMWMVKIYKKWSLWRHYVDFFPIKLIKTAELSPDKNYLLGSHPHGVLCSGAYGCFATSAAGWSSEYPGLDCRLLTLEGQFWIPGHRELALLSGSCSATKRSMEALLGRPGGLATVLVVGGAPESLNSDDDVIKLVLNKRKGFIKLALRFGVDLVPTFSFGENKIYGQISNPPGSLLRRIQDQLQHIVGFAPVLFFGRGVFQYNMGIVPYRNPINLVVGTPIPVERVPQPTQAQIENLHKKYVEELVKLYDTHNPQYGDKNIKLVIT